MDKKNFAEQLAAGIARSARSVPDFGEASGVPADRLDAFLGAAWADDAPPARREMLQMAAVLGVAPERIAGWLRPDLPEPAPPSLAEQQRKRQKHRARQERRNRSRDGEAGT